MQGQILVQYVGIIAEHMDICSCLSCLVGISYTWLSIP